MDGMTRASGSTTYTPSVNEVRQLRVRVDQGAGATACRAALIESGGDEDMAVELLRVIRAGSSLH